MKILKVNEYVLHGSQLNESYSENFLKKLVHRIVNSKTNNEYFSYFGHEVNIQSGTSDYADISIDGNINFDIDYDTLDVHFQSIGNLKENEIDAIVSALHAELDNRMLSVSVSFDENIGSHSESGYKLTQDDVALLKEWGDRDDDIEQIQRCLDEDGFVMTDRFNKRIDAETAIKMLGQEEFLSGLERSCFHWSASRGSGDKTVSFDTREWHHKTFHN